ncbi:sulfite exporter TauE/SafE family protein [Sphingobacterium griseoflavum]|nr:sulfite exporter TauE/SafE family protein [Sphingobacterium griseoflavum]
MVGITLGLVGSGGSILTVPIFVYVMGVDPILATTYSLFAVGTTAFIGSIRGVRNGDVDLSHVFHFGFPSLLTVFITRIFVLPLVPDVITIGSITVHQSVVLMLLFALVMLASSVSMIAPKTMLTNLFPKPTNGNKKTQVVLSGVLVGFVTGVVGAGGGFLIIPVLINFLHLSLRKAVATSLIIIAVNSFFGIMGDLEKFAVFDWSLLLRYTCCTIVGIFLGFSLAKKIKSDLLKKIFGYFIFAVAFSILLKELWG